jgi:hypothetical protein
MKNKYNEIIQAKKAAKEAGSQTMGLLIRKDKDVKFKLRDPNSKTKGSVCTTSMIDALKNKVQSLNASVFDKLSTLSKGGTKVAICDVIELLLRQRGRPFFIRSL